MAATVSLPLLLRYFELSTNLLLKLADDSNYVFSEPELTLHWHRNRVVSAQLNALTDTLLECDSDIDAEVFQDVLREIGVGNFTNVDGGDGELRRLVDAVERTNEAAREAFARSVVFLEMRGDSKHNRHLHANKDLDRSSLMEYCGLAMSAVRLPEIKKFLFDGTRVRDCDVPSEVILTKEERLLYIQRLIWRAIGWDPDTASNQIRLLLKNGHSELMNDKDVMEAVTKYVSCMTVAATNASPESDLAEYSHVGDGITRVVNVIYSEKVVTNDTIQSLSAPTSNSMTEHTNVEHQAFEQRQQLEVAKMRQQIHDDFHSLSTDEQCKTLAMAKLAQEKFLKQIMNTPPGAERVLLMKNINAETQKLLIIHKMCATSE
jgi:hypothetical protein